MQETAYTIFVVDDEPLLRMAVIEQLQEKNFQIFEFGSGAECLAALDKQPDLILLDIVMPEENGLDICRKIRKRFPDDLKVLFFSAHDDMETLLSAYEAGGNDFIPKNVNKEILLKKIDIAIAAIKQKLALKDQLSYAQQTAFSAMSNLGETGVTLQFLRSSFSCQDLQAMGGLLIDSLRQYSLTALIKIDNHFDSLVMSTEASSSPLEQAILAYVVKLGRIYQKGDRLVLNYPHTTILILGLDLNNEDLIGRLRDHLAIIAEGAGVRLEAMYLEKQRLMHSQSRLESAKELTKMLSSIETTQQNNHTQMENIIDQLGKEVEDAFIHLGLTDSQEILLHNIINRLTSQLYGLFEKEHQLTDQLYAIVDKQKKLLELS